MIGAAGGAAIGAATGGNPATSTIGAIGGAVVGAATDTCDLDLGNPFWRNNNDHDGYRERCGRDYRDR